MRSDDLSSNPSTVSPIRRWMVYTIIGGITLGHVVDMVMKREHWPFSNYPMWAGKNTVWFADAVRIVGLPADEPTKEVPLSADNFPPMQSLTLNSSLVKGMGKAEQGQPALLQQRARDLLAYYEKRRLDGSHDGPKLAGLRVYDVEWDMVPDASNFNTPTRNKLMIEVTAQSAKTSPSTGGVQ